MANVKIQNLPVKTPLDAMKIPTGGFGDYAVTIGDIADHFKINSGFATDEDLDNKANKSETLSGYGITDAYTKTEIDNILEKPVGSKTHDWASLSANTQQSTTVSVVGANVGDPVIAYMDVALNGTSIRAEMTSSGTATVYHYNPTGSAVDVASGTLYVKVL